MAVVLGACSANKSTTAQNKVEFKNVSAHIQKVFPGVSGEVIYFLQYRVEMDVQTEEEVQFNHLTIGETEVPIHSVKVGNTILNTNLDEHLSQSAENVTLQGSHQVHHKDREDSTVADLGQPEEIKLQYTTGGETHNLDIPDIQFEPNEYRPAANPGQRE